MSNIVKFPKSFRKTTPSGFKINLYSESEVEMVLFCVNIWGRHDTKYFRDDVRAFKPDFVIDALQRAYDSNLLSYEAREIINKIMKSIEPIHTPSMKGGVL